MGLFGKLGGKGRGSTQARFMKVLDKGDLNVAIQAFAVEDTWYKLGAGYVVPAQQTIHFGYGTPELPDNQGYLYINIADAGADVVGKIRLVQSNAQETVKFVIAEFNLASTHGSVTNKAMMIALPEQTQFPLVGEDSVVYLELSADNAADAMTIVDSTIYVPVTIYQ